jgi:5'-phosphate synthase pdxT subunit
VKIGVLALQGGFDLHAKRLKEIGHTAILVKKAEELNGIDGLIIPGGESTTLLKLCDKAFRDKISELVKGGLPLLTTCAGTILIANKVTNPPQESMKLLDIEVERNAYGRQVDSFITENIKTDKSLSDKNFEVVFIRAPKITETGKNVKVLISSENSPILVRDKNILAATFHPELSKSTLVHEYFAGIIQGGTNDPKALPV